MTTPTLFFGRFQGIKDNYIILSDPNPPDTRLFRFFYGLKKY